MTLKRKVALVVCVLVALVGGGVGYFYYSFGAQVDAALRSQGIANDAAKPLLDAVVTKKLKVGDSLEHAQQVLTYAGLEFVVERQTVSQPRLNSFYRTGPHCGFMIDIALDSEDKIAKIDIEETFTGP